MAKEIPQTLREQAYRELEEKIVTLEYKPGEIVSEVGLSSALGIGRTPIREALQRLAEEGLVRILPKRGVLITEIDAGTCVRLLEMRRVVERFIAQAACKNCTESERQKLREIAEMMEKAAATHDVRLCMDADNELNTLLMQSARNEFAAKSIKMMHGLFRRFYFLHISRTADMPTSARLHAGLATAIAEADEAAATDFIDRLMDYNEDFTRRSLGTIPEYLYS